MLTLYMLSHSLGSILIGLPLIAKALGLSWYLHTSCNKPFIKALTPVSAKIRAISSSLPCDCAVMVATAVALTFCNTLASRP